jgi:hypothetical protein
MTLVHSLLLLDIAEYIRLANYICGVKVVIINIRIQHIQLVSLSFWNEKLIIGRLCGRDD